MSGKVPFQWFSNKMILLQLQTHQHLHQIQLKILFWNLKIAARILTWEVPLTPNALVTYIRYSKENIISVYF